MVDTYLAERFEEWRRAVQRIQEAGFKRPADSDGPFDSLRRAWDVVAILTPRLVNALGKSRIDAAHLALLPEVIAQRIQDSHVVTLRLAGPPRVPPQRPKRGKKPPGGYDQDFDISGIIKDALGVVQRLQIGNLSGPHEPRSVVELRGIAQRPIVNGVEVEPLSEPRYLVVKALIDAGPDGLSKPELEKVKGDAVAYLRELAHDPEWHGAIIMPGRAWSRYGIKHC